MARPLAFDPQEKLHQAMMLFWRQGYEATSMQNLVEALNINRFSLYNTFGDKQALFSQAVELYEQVVFGRLLNTLMPAQDGLVRLYAYLDLLSQGLASQEGVSGCFLQNSLLEGGIEDQQVLQRIRGVLLRLRQALIDVLEAAESLEEIAPSSDINALADYLLLQVQGLIVLYGLGLTGQAQNAMQVIKHQIKAW